MIEEYITSIEKFGNSVNFSDNVTLHSFAIEISDELIDDFLSHTGPLFYMHNTYETVIGLEVVQRFNLSWKERYDKLRAMIENIKTSSRLYSKISNDRGPRIMGGFSFSRQLDAPLWEKFYHATFILPLIQIVKSANECYLRINLYEEKQLQIVIDILTSVKQRTDKVVHMKNPVLNIDYPISKEEWHKLIDKAVTLMESNNLQKVVLSRICHLTTKHMVNTPQIISNLQAQYPNCFIFFFRPAGDNAFFGASPELLCKLEDTTINTMALAGTITRGMDSEEDQHNARQLLNDPKEIHEHKIVVDMIVESLNTLSNEIKINYNRNPAILELSNVFHLITKIEASNCSNVDILEIVKKLHPTPALGGKPKDVASSFIMENEPQTRGHFGGPIGWVDLDLKGKFIVAIRSAVNKGKDTWLYAGAGIVDRSEADLEWEETELKFKPILEAMEVEI